MFFLTNDVGHHDNLRLQHTKIAKIHENNVELMLNNANLKNLGCQLIVLRCIELWFERRKRGN